MESKLKGNGFEYTYKEDGSWIYKAIPFKKKKPVEKPQIKVVELIEKNYQEFFDKRVAAIVRDITKYLG